MANLTIHPIQAVVKTRQGKGAARELRRNGMIPAVVYAPGEQPEHFGVNLKDLNKAIQIGHFFTHAQEIVVGGKALKVLPRDIQRHPVLDTAIHIDFTRFNPNSKVHVDVMVTITDQDKCPGLKGGGVLQLIETSIEVVCRADSIPEEIKVSVEGLDIGESVHLSSIKLPEGVKAAVTNRDLTIVSIIATRTSAMEEAEAAAAAAAAAGPVEVPATAQKAPADAGAAPAAGAKDAKAAAPAAAKAPAAKK